MRSLKERKMLRFESRKRKLKKAECPVKVGDNERFSL